MELDGLGVAEHHASSAGSREGSAWVRNGMGDDFKKPLPMGAQGDPIPHGFPSAEAFQQFSKRLRSGLPAGTQPLVQGSAVTGRSYRTGEPFDLDRQSDLDIGWVGPDLFGKRRALGLKAKDGTRIGPLSPQDLENLGLLGLRDQLSALAGRPVKFMLFESLEAAWKRPSLWVS